MKHPWVMAACYQTPRPGLSFPVGPTEAAMADHDHHHDHDDHSELSEMQLRVRALETVLAEKGYIDPKALDAVVETFETKVGPHIGARVIAKAWVDPQFKNQLLSDASKALA